MNEIELPNSSAELTEKLEQIGEEILKVLPEHIFPMEHFLHAGMYVRTIKMAKGTIGIGAFIKVPTVVIINGHLRLNSGEKVYEVKGYHVLKGQANRKQMAVALEDSEFTMMFATNAKTVEEAEREFTDDFYRLQNHKEITNERSSSRSNSSSGDGGQCVQLAPAGQGAEVGHESADGCIEQAACSAEGAVQPS